MRFINKNIYEEIKNNKIYELKKIYGEIKNNKVSLYRKNKYNKKLIGMN